MHEGHTFRLAHPAWYDRANATDMLQERVVVPSPYADAVTLPSRQSIDAAITEHKLHRSTSTSSSVDSTDSASQIQNYISTHYNVRSLGCRHFWHLVTRSCIWSAH
jgi:hypothetical protein